jgi:hypothetical protein
VRVARGLPVVAFSLLLAACGGTSKRAAPPITPQQVVAAYFAAGNAHDKARARPLLTPGFAALSFNFHDGWFNSNVNVTHLKTSKPRYDRYGADVPVSFIWDHHDGRTTPDKVSGYYCLIRKKPGGPWIIADEGDC